MFGMEGPREGLLSWPLLGKIPSPGIHKLGEYAHSPFDVATLLLRLHRLKSPNSPHTTHLGYTNRYTVPTTQDSNQVSVPVSPTFQPPAVTLKPSQYILRKPHLSLPGAVGQSVGFLYLILHPALPEALRPYTHCILTGNSPTSILPAGETSLGPLRPGTWYPYCIRSNYWKTLRLPHPPLRRALALKTFYSTLASSLCDASSPGTRSRV